MEGLAEDRRKSAHQDLGHRLDKTTTSADVGASSRERPLGRPRLNFAIRLPLLLIQLPSGS